MYLKFLRELIPNPRAGRNIRFMQVLVLIVAIYSTFGWLDSQPAPEVIGVESLDLDVTAPVEHPSGPWLAGMTFTEANPGVPLSVAGNATVTAHYKGDGLQPSGETWTAILVMEELEGTKAWWRIERSLPVSINDGVPHIALPLVELTQELSEQATIADVAGTLHMELRVMHMGTIMTTGPQSSVRVAVLELAPTATGELLMQVRPDTQTFQSFPSPGFPWFLAYPVVGLLLLEVGLRIARKDWPAWDRYPATKTVEVDHLIVPPGAHDMGFDGLMRWAHVEKIPVLLDKRHGLAFVAHPVSIWAKIPGVAPAEAPRDEPPVEPQPRDQAAPVGDP